MTRRQISPERKGLYYLGAALQVIGVISFLSVWAGGFLGFGFGSSAGPRVVFGMALILVGGILSKVGQRGLAGSGIILDPEEARRDVEPWSRMTGGMVKDALDEAGIDLNKSDSSDDLPFDERLRRLQKLREDGIVDEEEYEATKKRILESA